MPPNASLTTGICFLCLLKHLPAPDGVKERKTVEPAAILITLTPGMSAPFSLSGIHDFYGAQGNHLQGPDQLV
jgi:hypothetical protein